MDHPLYAKGRSQRFHIKPVSGDDVPANFFSVAFEATYNPDRPPAVKGAPPESAWGELLDWIVDAWRDEGRKRTRVDTARGTTADKFWQFVYRRLKRGGTHWLFAYDLYPFLCLAKFFDEVDKGELSLCLSEEDNGGALNFGRKRKRQGLLICDNPPTLIICHRPGGGVLKMLDLANFGFAPDGDMSGTLLRRSIEVTDATRHLVHFVQANGLGALQHTAAAQGYYYYRKSHMSVPIQVHPYKMALEMEREALYGGRCECARIGKIDGHVYHLDVNAMYTHLAAIHDFPNEFLGYNDKIPGHEVGDLLHGAAAVADVTIRVGEPVAPIKTNERTLFPIGIYRTVLCSPELELVQLHGEILECHRLALYSAWPLFRSFAGSMKSLKTFAASCRNDNLVSLVKGMANGMYGKWGQHSRRWVTTSEQQNAERWEMWWQPHPESGDPVPWRSIAGLVQYQDCERESKLACPVISAFMTSYGRSHLWRLLVIAGHDNVYYWDTDSLMVNADGLDRLEKAKLLHADICGALKLREESDHVEIYGVKHYLFGDRYVASGVSSAEQDRLHGSVIVQEHAGFNEGLWHRRRGEARRIARKRGRTRKYNQGRVLASGKVLPFNFVTRAWRNDNA